MAIFVNYVIVVQWSRSTIIRPASSTFHDWGKKLEILQFAPSSAYGYLCSSVKKTVSDTEEYIRVFTWSTEKNGWYAKESSRCQFLIGLSIYGKIEYSSILSVHSRRMSLWLQQIEMNSFRVIDWTAGNWLQFVPIRCNYGWKRVVPIQREARILDSKSRDPVS